MGRNTGWKDREPGYSTSNKMDKEKTGRAGNRTRTRNTEWDRAREWKECRITLRRQRDEQGEQCKMTREKKLKVNVERP